MTPKPKTRSPAVDAALSALEPRVGVWGMRDNADQVATLWRCLCATPPDTPPGQMGPNWHRPDVARCDDCDAPRPTTCPCPRNKPATSSGRCRSCASARAALTRAEHKRNPPPVFGTWIGDGPGIQDGWSCGESTHGAHVERCQETGKVRPPICTAHPDRRAYSTGRCVSCAHSLAFRNRSGPAAPAAPRGTVERRPLELETEITAELLAELRGDGNGVSVMLAGADHGALLVPDHDGPELWNGWCLPPGWSSAATLSAPRPGGVLWLEAPPRCARCDWPEPEHLAPDTPRTGSASEPLCEAFQAPDGPAQLDLAIRKTKTPVTRDGVRLASLASSGGVADRAHPWDRDDLRQHGKAPAQRSDGTWTLIPLAWLDLDPSTIWLLDAGEPLPADPVQPVRRRRVRTDDAQACATRCPACGQGILHLVTSEDMGDRLGCPGDGSFAVCDDCGATLKLTTIAPATADALRDWSPDPDTPGFHRYHGSDAGQAGKEETEIAVQRVVPTAVLVVDLARVLDDPLGRRVLALAAGAGS